VIYLLDVVGHGVPAALLSVTYIAGCLLVRPLTDNLQPRYLLMAASYGVTAMIVLIRLGGSLSVTYVCFGLIGLFLSMFWPQLMGWVSTDLDGPELGRTLSRFNLSWSMGTVISPFLAGWLSRRAPELPLHASAALWFATACLLTGAALSLPRVRSDYRSAASQAHARSESDTSTPLRFAAWVGVFACFFVVGAVLTIFPVWAKEQLDIGKVVIGALLTARTACCTLGFIVMGRAAFWHHRAGPMLAGQAALAGLVLLLLYAHTAWTLAPLLAGIGVLVALSYFYSLFHGVAGSSRGSARSALHEALASAGTSCGALAGGFIYQYRSMREVLLCAAGVVFVALVAQIVIVIKTRCAVWARPANQ
jgi:MFS family permease